MKKDWKVNCEKTFNNLNANSHKWGVSHEWNRAITRDFYLGVFDSGTPNPSGLISEDAYVHKMNNGKVTMDHCFSPQFIGRMVMDNREIYLNDYDKFKDIFWHSCKTIIVTPQENIKLSRLTSHTDDGYKVLVPTHMKYKHLNIKLYQRPNGKTAWKYSQPIGSNILEVIPELVEYEKNYLV